MARRFIYIVCPPNGKEEWLVDFNLFFAPNGKEQWLADLYTIVCP